MIRYYKTTNAGQAIFTDIVCKKMCKRTISCKECPFIEGSYYYKPMMELFRIVPRAKKRRLEL